MKKLLLALFIILLMPVLPASAETSYMDFVNYTYSWLGEDPDGLWRMTRNDVIERLRKQNAFTCKALFDSSAGKSYYLCRSGSGFSGKYRMRFYFSRYGLLEAVECRAEDEYIQELAECYDGQIPTLQNMWKDIREKYGESGRNYTVDNDIFTDSPGQIYAHTGIGSGTYAVFGQNVLQYSFDRYAVMYVFCSDSYAVSHSAGRN